MIQESVQTLLDKPISAICTGVSIDSRRLQKGELFVAIKGHHFDGHNFLQDAEKKGAVAALVETPNSNLILRQIVVPNTLEALAQLAHEHRRLLSLPIIALTGSNGKTTVKEMIAAILPKPALATQGNLNNHLGVPLSVLKLKKEHRYAVFELGANHAGEIAYTARIVQPTLALINNIAPAHVEGFGSIEGVARAKGEIYASLSESGIAVVNEEDDYAHFWDNLLEKKRVIRFSLTVHTEIGAENIQLDNNGKTQFQLIMNGKKVPICLQVPGIHNVRNAVAAAACCYGLDITAEYIQQGLESFGGVMGRMSYKVGKNNSVIIDDTYNANLSSVLTALEVMAHRPGKKIFVFGGMGELGELAAAHHTQVGEVAKKLGIHYLFCYGVWSKLTTQAFGNKGEHYTSQDELVSALLPYLQPDTTILVKGSRSSAMEKIVEKLVN